MIERIVSSQKMTSLDLNAYDVIEIDATDAVLIEGGSLWATIWTVIKHAGEALL